MRNSSRSPRQLLALLLCAATLGAACGARLPSTALTSAKERAAGGGGGAAVTPGSPGAGPATVSSQGPGPVTSPSGGAGAGPTGSVVPLSPSSHVLPGQPGTSLLAASSPATAFGGPPPGGNGGSTDVGVTATEIDLGNVSTQGGPVPGLFSGAYYGAAAYAAYVNSRGGIYGRRLVVKTHDDQLEAAQNKAAVDDLIPQVLGFLGSFSLEDGAGASDMQSARTPDVGVALSPDRQHIAVNYPVTPLGSGWAIGPENYMKQKYGSAVTDHLAFFIEDNPTAIQSANQEQAALIHAGWKIVYSRKIEATETNFQGDVKTMQSDGVKSLILEGEVSTMARMASAMHDANFTIPLATWGAPAYDPGFIQLSNGGAEGAVLNQQLAMYNGEDASTVPEVGLFDTWMQRVAPSQTVDLYAAYSWASGALLTQALIKAGPHLTRKGLLAALSTFDTFDDNGMFAPAGPATKRPPTCFIVIDIKHGKFVRDPDDPSAGYRCNDGGYFQE